MMTKTYKELRELDFLVGAMYAKNPLLKDGKFGYAYKRFSEKNFIPTTKEYNQAITDARIDSALTDTSTKALITDQNPNSRGFQYDKAGLKTVMKAENELQEKFFAKEIEVEPYILKTEDVPENLTDEEHETLAGLLIPEIV